MNFELVLTKIHFLKPEKKDIKNVPKERQKNKCYVFQIWANAICEPRRGWTAFL